MISRKNVKKLYSDSLFKKFRYLFFHTLFEAAQTDLNDKKKVARTKLKKMWMKSQKGKMIKRRMKIKMMQQRRK